jgi:NAD(P)-dependent dehydrogenase (short-subunit alcohol dehydrogenase family)
MRGRVAFVTGGASGIGRALCGALVARGASVVVADINASGAAAVARELSARGPGSATSLSLDVADAVGFEHAVGGAHADAGRLDLLFNNAGIGIGGPVEELTPAHWERALDVNLRGVIHGVQAAYPLMLRQRFGHIVNTASLAGLLPFPLGVPYAMTKHAVVGLSVSLRCEAKTYGVRVSAVCPGVIDTPILDAEGHPICHGRALRVAGASSSVTPTSVPRTRPRSSPRTCSAASIEIARSSSRRREHGPRGS